jgi:hypothetical protein
MPEHSCIHLQICDRLPSVQYQPFRYDHPNPPEQKKLLSSGNDEAYLPVPDLLRRSLGLPL